MHVHTKEQNNYGILGLGFLRRDITAKIMLHFTLNFKDLVEVWKEQLNSSLTDDIISPLTSDKKYIVRRMQVLVKYVEDYKM